MTLAIADDLDCPSFSQEELRSAASPARARRGARAEIRRPNPFDDGEPTIVARDQSMLAVLEKVRKVAPTEATVLLLGESGTGKELLARSLHRESSRARGPFVAVNCAAISETLLESEIFGHEKGAFTDAVADRCGRFELADGGTLFFDEVGELPPQLQVKFLRVLQERCFERVGGVRTISVNVRIVAATNCDLVEKMRVSSFRQDFYYRLAVFPIHIPPLRERLADIIPIAEALLLRISRRLGQDSLSLDDDARARLVSYSWPGNVRELGNVLERAAILAEGATIGTEFIVTGQPASTACGGATVMGEKLADVEKEAIRRMLALEFGNRKQTAARLGIGLQTLYDKLKRYDLV